jgi:hypothetical protein
MVSVHFIYHLMATTSISHVSPLVSTFTFCLPLHTFFFCDRLSTRISPLPLIFRFASHHSPVSHCLSIHCTRFLVACPLSPSDLRRYSSLACSTLILPFDPPSCPLSLSPLVSALSPLLSSIGCLKGNHTMSSLLSISPHSPYLHIQMPPKRKADGNPQGDDIGATNLHDAARDGDLIEV